MDNLRIPPQNIDAETAVLSSLLAGDTDSLNLLTAGSFYKTAHQTIFQAAEKLNNAGQNIDAVAIKLELESAEKLEDVGGMGFLYNLMEQPLAINMEHYCRVIKEKHTLRRFLEIASVIGSTVHGGGNVPDIVDDIQQMVLSVDGVDPGKECYDIRERIIPAQMRWQEAKTKGIGVRLMSGLHDVYSVTGSSQPGDLIIIAGRPSMGKSALALSITANISRRGVPGAFFSLEMSNNQLEDRLASMESKVNGKKFTTGEFTKENWTAIIEAMNKISKWPLFYDDTPAMSYQQIRQKARRLKAKHNIQYMVVDYLQLARGDSGETREREIASITGAMKQTAKELEIPVILLSQLNRGVEARANKRPMLSDLRESGAIEQDADLIMFLYRDEYYNEGSIESGIAEVNIAKHRNGPTATVKVMWRKEIVRFENWLRAKEGQPYDG